MCFWVLFILSFLIGSISSAQEETESGFPSGSAIDVAFVFNKELDNNTKLLNKENSKLIELIKKYDYDNNLLIDAINIQNKAWLQYYPNECYISGRLTNSGGSWPSTYSVICANEVVKERIKTISSIVSCIESVPTHRKKENETFDYSSKYVASNSNNGNYKYNEDSSTSPFVDNGVTKIYGESINAIPVDKKILPIDDEDISYTELIGIKNACLYKLGSMILKLPETNDIDTR